MHIYEKDGKKLPSVTTIIHSLGNEEIIKWANSLGFRHIKYEQELDKYAQNGSLIPIGYKELIFLLQRIIDAPSI